MIAEQQTQQDYFTQKRIELLIEMANKKMETEVQLVRKMVMQLEQELVELRRQMNSNHSNIQQSMTMAQANAMPPKVETHVHVVQQAPQPQSSGANGSSGVRTETSSAAPRYGKYTSNDVSIEKFFNFAGGARRK